jgi:molybdopterin/thiamine biosynthesis adenylyltransferase
MDKDSFLKLIENLNQQRNVNFSVCASENSKYEAHFCGTVSLSNGNPIQLRISFTNQFPLILPDFFVMQNDKFLVHVGSDGKMCLFDMNAMLILQDMEEQIVVDCFDQALNILNILPGSQQYDYELCQEFDAYWCSLSKEMVYSCVSTADVKYEQYSILFTNGNPVVAKTKNEAEVIAYNNLQLAHGKYDFDKECIFIKLRAGSEMLSLKSDYKWNMVRNYILSNVSSSNKRQFRKFLDKKVRNYVRYIFLIYPTDIGDVLFGFRVEFNNSRYTKIANTTAAKVAPVYVNRIDYEYLTLRGGSFSELKRNSVLLLGCGSVGGYLANALCQLGILVIDILDKDIFTPENVHRHFLGFDALSKKGLRYKADLVKERLEAMYPYVDIDSLNYQDRTVEAFLQNENRLAKYDIIVSALGEPTINLEINKILYEHHLNVPLICCFNEPYGIGGHAIAVNVDRGSCLQCLYTDVASSERVPFRGSLVLPNQNFKKKISGCSSAFVPYSCLDSQQTALLTARMVLDVLNKKINRNTFKTWIGTSDELVSHGYSVSKYYEANQASTIISFCDFGNGQCKTCRNNE